MPKAFYVRKKRGKTFKYVDARRPLFAVLKKVPRLKARGNRPLQLNFEDQLDALILFHLEEYESGRELLQALHQDDFARHMVVRNKKIKHSTFFEAINTRGLEQMVFVFNELYAYAQKVLPQKHAALGNLMAIDGSLIEAVNSMHWANYNKSTNKAKIHLAFDINRGIPRKLKITNGKTYEGAHLQDLIETGQTGVLDRGYQCHKHFDQLQDDGKHFVCRIKGNTIREVVSDNPLDSDEKIFYDKLCRLGQPNFYQTAKPVRVVGFYVDNKKFWVATDRCDLTALQVAEIYGLRWNVETFFGWWKQHVNVYPLIARSNYGFAVQILSGLITYLLLAIYCYEQFGERVSIARVRELRHQIKNDYPHFSQIASATHSREKRRNHKKNKNRKK